MHPAADPSLTPARPTLARHPIAVDCARAATDIAKAPAEVVVFEDERAFVVATADRDQVLQPRHLWPAETRLLRSGERSAHAEGRTAIGIVDKTGRVVAALTTPIDAGTPFADALHSLARMVSAALILGEADDAEMEIAAVQGLRDTVLVLTPDMTIRWANRAVGSLLGRSPADVIGRSAVEFVHPDDLEGAFNAIQRMSEGLQVYRLKLRLLDSAGAPMPVEVTGMDHADDDLLGGMVLSVRSVETGAEVESTAEQSRARADAILSGLLDGIVATDEFGAITFVNDAARELFGIGRDRAAAQLRPEDFPLLDDSGRIETADLNGSRTGTSKSADEAYGVLSARGELRYVTTRREAVTDRLGNGLGHVTVFHDVTAERRAAEELRTQALHDQLTGLPNRRQLENRLAELVSVQPPVNVAAVFIDLDGFKLVNDTHGHRMGDQLVRIAAQRLQSSLRAGDLLVRQGGDEFVALQIGPANIDEAVESAERLRVALARPYTIDNHRFDLTASIGVALAPSDQLQGELLVQHADIALYAAKARGRDRVEVFDAELADAVSLEERQRRLLRDALDNDRLVMHFQPLVDTETTRTTGYEALVRLRTPSGDLIGPAAFMEAVTSSAMMWELDCTAFDLSCQAAQALAQAATDDVPVIACNFSSVSLTHPEFVDVVLDTVARHGVDPERMCIEITESAAFDAGPASIEALFELNRRGFRLALDDFGTGYSSLAHLRDLPIATVKVDKTFITALADKNSERAIAEAVVGLAHDLGLGVVAEGVETAEHLQQVQEIGFGTVQGWHYSPALPLTECVQDWLETEQSRGES